MAWNSIRLEVPGEELLASWMQNKDTKGAVLMAALVHQV